MPKTNAIISSKDLVVLTGKSKIAIGYIRKCTFEILPIGNEACLNIHIWEKNKSTILMTFVLITLLIFYFIFEFGLFFGIFVLYHISIFGIHRVVK